MELDCWDGDNNDPEITHGFFMCQTIRFKVRKLLGHLAAKTQPIKNRQSFLLKCKETNEAMLHNAILSYYTGVRRHQLGMINRHSISTR